MSWTCHKHMKVTISEGTIGSSPVHMLLLKLICGSLGEQSTVAGFHKNRSTRPPGGKAPVSSAGA